MLKIKSTSAQIGIETRNARLDTRQIRGEQSIRTVKPEIEISGSFPTIEIDSTETRKEFGYKSMEDIVREGAELGKQRAIQAIRRIAEDGNRMINIKRGVPAAIPEFALKNSQPEPVSLEMKLLGTKRPKTYIKGGYEIGFKEGRTDIDYTPGRIEALYHPGKVEVYMKRYPSLEITPEIDIKK